MSNLKDWIAKEMTVDVEHELSKHKERVKQLVRLTPSGDVNVIPQKLTEKRRILAYLIGKAYSKAAGYSSGTVTNSELTEKLGIKEGTVKFSLFELRNEGFAEPLGEGVNQLRVANIGGALSKYFGGENESE